MRSRDHTHLLAPPSFVHMKITEYKISSHWGLQFQMWSRLTL